MSRVGKQVIDLGSDVTVQLSGSLVTVRGKGGSLNVPFPSELELKEEGGKARITRKSDNPKVRSLHGLTRALLQNAVTGLRQGWSKTLILNGVGYKAVLSGKTLTLNLGHSQPVTYPVPEGIEVKVEKNTKVIIKGADRELVGRTAWQIRNFRPPEPYLGKGVRYEDETLRRKAGKSGGGEKK